MRFAKLLRKKSNSQGKAHSASVFFGVTYGSATSATSASLRPFGISCITQASLKVRKRDAETQRTQRTQGLRGGLRGGIDDNTTACRCLVLLLLSQRQLPSASVFDPKEGRDTELLHVMARSAKWDVRRETVKRR